MAFFSLLELLVPIFEYFLSFPPIRYFNVVGNLVQEGKVISNRCTEDIGSQSVNLRVLLSLILIKPRIHELIKSVLLLLQLSDVQVHGFLDVERPCFDAQYFHSCAFEEADECAFVAVVGLFIYDFDGKHCAIEVQVRLSDVVASQAFGQSIWQVIL